MAFQPHRYTRTRDCFNDFIEVLTSVDSLLLTEVYAAGEAPIQGADAAALMQAIQTKLANVQFVPTPAELPQAILQNAQEGDVVIVMGAGSIGQVASKTKQLAEELAA